MTGDVQDTLFSTPTQAPLAHQLRPSALDQIVGQRHFLNDRFKAMIKGDNWSGLIFWGPPGTGKTTLATVIANETRRRFESRSAVTSGVKELREVLQGSEAAVKGGYPAWILFVDEVHRLNKAQQDILLPYLESGAIRFIGATTENPSFEINNAIASRCVIFSFKPLSRQEIREVLARGRTRDVAEEVIDAIADVALGDARRALTLLDHLMMAHPEGPIGKAEFEALAHSQSLYYDKKSESHYDTISAFIKSVRASDPDAALYYLARMLKGGEDPKFIARRLIILAAEDIGNANPLALVLASNAFSAVHAIGMPEARIVLAQATTYLACSEKSNRSYVGIERALSEVEKTGDLQVPLHLRNAVTSTMREFGYGKGYRYAHDYDGGWVKMDCLPDELARSGKRFYEPSERGPEKRFADMLRARRGEGAPTPEK